MIDVHKIVMQYHLCSTTNKFTIPLIHFFVFLYIGKYYSDCFEQELLSHALSRQDASKLWEISVSLVKFAPQEMSKALR